MQITAVLGTMNNDAELVTEALSGQRDAFGRIVARYQTLICSLAFSATGNLSESEDLAQETFLTAWKQLAGLRERGKLRAWLCQIARHLIYDQLRQQGREPSHAAEALDLAHDVPAVGPLPSERAMSQEEQALLWTSIESIPEVYREPLVLYYREHKSIEAVAGALDLSEDAVKQRLSRGRKLLHRQVLAFVEGALEKTNPNEAFTMGVLAALPGLTTSAKAATFGAVAAKGSAIVKSAGLAALLNAILGVIGVFLATYFGYRLDVESARSLQRRALVGRFYRALVACLAAFFLVSIAVSGWLLLTGRPTTALVFLAGLGLAYFIAAITLILWVCRSSRKIRLAEPAAILLTPLFEYRSKLTLLGWPLVHIRLRGGLDRGPVKAWIAAGDAAIGIIFAFGGLAIAPISLGGLAAGVVTLGGLAVGLVAFGGFSLGVWAVGGMAAGWLAFGGSAVGWAGAQGGLALARDFAVGAAAFAEIFVREQAFFQMTQVALRYALWLNLLYLCPLILWGWSRQKSSRQSSHLRG